MERDIKEIKDQLKDLTKKIDRIEKSINSIFGEVGANSGKSLADQISQLEKDVTQIKGEVAATKVDTSNMRKTIEFGSKVDDEIKKALVAIYRNTDELEKYLIPDERET